MNINLDKPDPICGQEDFGKEEKYSQLSMIEMMDLMRMRTEHLQELLENKTQLEFEEWRQGYDERNRR